MAEPPKSTFKELELAGWDAKAGAYDDYAGRITVQVVDRLLDAAGVRPGQQLLDIACGPGYLAGAAAKRGVRAVGIDFAPGMVREAQKNFPSAEFRVGDAESLAFDAGSFDAAVCGFGIGHLPDADKSLSEVLRVLRPGGRYAFSWWCTPNKHEFFTLVLGAVKKHGTLDVPLPPAPPMFRFSEAAECARSLEQTGFRDIRVEEHSLFFEVEEPKQVLGLLCKSAVRLPMVLELQTKDALSRIHQALVHHRTLLPRHIHLPAPKAGKCYPCVRYVLSPMSRAAHRRHRTAG